jgi:hypothetical protein
MRHAKKEQRPPIRELPIGGVAQFRKPGPSDPGNALFKFVMFINAAIRFFS